MNILYIHGLDSSPKPSKVALLKQYGSVTALHLNYRDQKDAFSILDHEIRKSKSTHIVGSSMGGYLGFWLAEKHKLPCLLFNPALVKRTIELEVEKHTNQCPKRLIVLGELDTIVNPYETIKFLKTTPHNNVIQSILLASNMAHQISDENFNTYTKLYFNLL